METCIMMAKYGPYLRVLMITSHVNISLHLLKSIDIVEIVVHNLMQYSYLRR